MPEVFFNFAIGDLICGRTVLGLQGSQSPEYFAPSGSRVES